MAIRTAKKGARPTRKEGGRLFLFIFVVLLFSLPIFKEPRASSSFCNIPSENMGYIENAIASQPALAGNTQAQAVYMGILAQESSFNTQAIGKYTDAEGQTVEASYGMGQVNYYAHQAQINEMVLASTGQDISALPYDQKKAIAGQWLLDHPQEATNLSAQIFASALSAAGGDLTQAALNYCGGCDPNYLEHVQGKMQYLESCGDGTAVYFYTPEDGSSPFILQCPEIDLAEALNKASAYYSASVLEAGQKARFDGYKNAAEATMVNENGKVTALKHIIGKIGDQYCFGVYDTGFDIIGTLLDPVNMYKDILWNAAFAAIDLACGYVAAYANNLLSSICIPFPPISMPGFSFEGPEHKYCNGYSLNDFVYFQQLPMAGPLMGYSPTAQELGKDYIPTTREIRKKIGVDE